MVNPIVQTAPLVIIPVTAIQPVFLVGLVNTRIKIFSCRLNLVNYVPPVHILRPLVCPVQLIATTVQQEKKIPTMVLGPAVIVRIVMLCSYQIRVVQAVRNVMQGHCRKRVAPNADHVVLEHTVMGANTVPQVDTAMAVTQLIHHVGIVRPVITTRTLDKVRVYHASQGNSIILPVLSSANLAKRILFQVRNIVKFPVNHALLVVHPNKAVPNVPIVHQVNS
jgi:hypothetical protein